MIKELIEQAIQKTERIYAPHINLRFTPAVPLERGIPTLKPGVFRPLTPQLKKRYEMFGRWENATHGHWLGLDDMETLWRDAIDDQLLEEIKISRVAGEEHYPGDASSLFRPERLCLFAGDDNNYEKIYLLWTDFGEEPEPWVHDPNGTSRYKDLANYLKAYLADDLSASESPWQLALAEDGKLQRERRERKNRESGSSVDAP
jgi:hypothetical protein